MSEGTGKSDFVIEFLTELAEVVPGVSLPAVVQLAGHSLPSVEHQQTV